LEEDLVLVEECDSEEALVEVSEVVVAEVTVILEEMDGNI
jgi:hypothetical protein